MLLYAPCPIFWTVISKQPRTICTLFTRPLVASSKYFIDFALMINNLIYGSFHIKYTVEMLSPIFFKFSRKPHLAIQKVTCKFCKTMPTKFLKSLTLSCVASHYSEIKSRIVETATTQFCLRLSLDIKE